MIIQQSYHRSMTPAKLYKRYEGKLINYKLYLSIFLQILVSFSSDKPQQEVLTSYLSGRIR